MADFKYKIIKNKKKRKLNSKIEIKDSFTLVSRSKNFTIGNDKITNIKITNKKFVHTIVKKKVDVKYNKLLIKLTELLIEDDETGETIRIILNEIEKFRQEIKNKYRIYLTKKELKLMAMQLTKYQKEARKKFIILQNTNMMQLSDEVQIGRSK